MYLHRLTRQTLFQTRDTMQITNSQQQAPTVVYSCHTHLDCPTSGLYGLLQYYLLLWLRYFAIIIALY